MISLNRETRKAADDEYFALVGMRMKGHPDWTRAILAIHERFGDRKPAYIRTKPDGTTAVYNENTAFLYVCLPLIDTHKWWRALIETHNLGKAMVRCARGLKPIGSFTCTREELPSQAVLEFDYGSLLDRINAAGESLPKAECQDAQILWLRPAQDPEASENPEAEIIYLRPQVN